jgi:hypothetical protein
MRARESASSWRASALASACATSCAKSAIRCSDPTGNGVSSTVETSTAPHSRPPSSTGVPTLERKPKSRSSSAVEPGVCE